MPGTFNPVVEPSKQIMEESTYPDSKSPPTMQEIVNEDCLNFQPNQDNNLLDNAKTIKQEYVPDIANENTHTNWTTSWPFKFFLKK